MLKSRRIIALLQSIFFLHAFVLGSGVLCVTSHATHDVKAASGHEHHEHPDHAPSDERASDDSAPASERAPLHCSAATTCSFVVAADVNDVLERAPASSGTSWVTPRALHSAVVTPEPPPPRA